MAKFFDVVLSGDRETLEALKHAGFSGACAALSGGARAEGVEGLEVFNGALFESLHEYRKARRSSASLVVVRGGDIGANKEIVREKGVDVLLDPVGFSSVNLDAETVTVAREKGVRFGVSLASFLELPPFKRAQLIGKWRFFSKVLGKKDFHPLFFSGAKNPSQVRPPRELAAFATVLGFSLDQGLRGLSSLPLSMIQGKRGA
ncbi:MAG TPA: RNase P subunit p30 family protein [archaeon]|nr:RNase P subunit p30 family protein [archaeon]